MPLLQRYDNYERLFDPPLPHLFQRVTHHRRQVIPPDRVHELLANLARQANITELVEAADDKHLSKTIARYGRVDLLCLDELGYLELDRRGAELLFQVFTERDERSSIAIASNSASSEWARTFTDPRRCAAIVDRLTFDASIIETGTESVRLRITKRRRTSTRVS